MVIDDQERISALVDDEINGAELKAALDQLRDEEALGAWERYHLISDVLHNNYSSPASRNLSGRIQAALEQESELHLTPIRTFRIPPAFWRQAAGIAIAASVTAAAILGVQYLNGSQVPGMAPSVATVDSDLDQASATEPEQTLDVYLVNHNEYAATSGMQGVLPYVRMVGYK